MREDDGGRAVSSFRRSAQGITVDVDNTATVAEPVQQGIHHVFWLQEVVPVFEVKVGSDYCWTFCFIPFLHELEETVHLFSGEGEVAEFIKYEQVVSA